MEIFKTGHKKSAVDALWEVCQKDLLTKHLTTYLQVYAQARSPYFAAFHTRKILTTKHSGQKHNNFETFRAVKL